MSINQSPSFVLMCVEVIKDLLASCHVYVPPGVKGIKRFLLDVLDVGAFWRDIRGVCVISSEGFRIVLTSRECRKALLGGFLYFAKMVVGYCFTIF